MVSRGGENRDKKRHRLEEEGADLHLVLARNSETKRGGRGGERYSERYHRGTQEGEEAQQKQNGRRDGI